ncbi:MAG TPA: YihY/virulence factor BrkB family protein, partial [Polyangia bacterium]
MVLRQVTDYLTFVVVTPILSVAAATLGAAATSSGAIRFARDTLGLGRLIDLALRSSSIVVACSAMFTMYVVMPNTRTRLRSALLGALVSGVLWQLALTLYVNAQSSVARFNALYAGFATIPIFLVWVYVSWLVTLVGAALAAAHQHEGMLVQQRQLGAFDQELRETVGLAVTARVARTFLAGAPPWTTAALAGALQVPEALVDETVTTLVAHGVLARTAGGPVAGVILARD